MVASVGKGAGEPIRTDRFSRATLADREACSQLYQTVRQSVEDGIRLLQSKRDKDPLRDLFSRTLLHAQSRSGTDPGAAKAAVDGVDKTGLPNVRADQWRGLASPEQDARAAEGRPSGRPVSGRWDPLASSVPPLAAGVVHSRLVVGPAVATSAGSPTSALLSTPSKHSALFLSAAAPAVEDHRQAAPSMATERSALHLLRASPQAAEGLGSWQAGVDAEQACNAATGEQPSAERGVEEEQQRLQQRPKLHLKPRTQPVDAALYAKEDGSQKLRSSVFGGARPRELILKHRGADEGVVKGIDDSPQSARSPQSALMSPPAAALSKAHLERQASWPSHHDRQQQPLERESWRRTAGPSPLGTSMGGSAPAAGKLAAMSESAAGGGSPRVAAGLSSALELASAFSRSASFKSSTSVDSARNRSLLLAAAAPMGASAAVGMTATATGKLGFTAPPVYKVVTSTREAPFSRLIEAPPPSAIPSHRAASQGGLPQPAVAHYRSREESSQVGAFAAHAPLEERWGRRAAYSLEAEAKAVNTRG
eukprot:SM000028S10215  [mRNA]  locus=s28:949715:952583:- [translate_table: standard]